jgi:hypothetical protein
MIQKIAFSLLISFFIRTYSQEKKINFQLSFGTTLSIPKTSKLTDSNLEGSPAIKSISNIGAFILPSFNYSLTKKMSLDFGLGYYLDRFSVENTVGPSMNKGIRNNSQIQTPININFHLGNSNSYLLGIGGFANFMLSAKENGKTTIDYSMLNKYNPSDVSFQTTSSENYSTNIKKNFNSLGLGAFIQLKKNFILSSHSQGFLFIKINQYLNSIKTKPNTTTYYSSDLIIKSKNEKQPTTINLGIGINL